MRNSLLGALSIYLGTWGSAFSWRIFEQGSAPASRPDLHIQEHAPTSLTNVYSLALNELQELESEPLCHRNAARLLVNYCQILGGNDGDTVPTDSGRASRDFVDSYAASLAICDLERGNFHIPLACSQFRETTLAQLPFPTKPELHVSTPEIDRCLEGLAQSDSAWNTWVSYRHKALRFCEAARVDHDKDENIRLYQRLTNILSRLTVEVEEKIETRMRGFDDAFDRTIVRLNDLEPRFSTIVEEAQELEKIIAMRLTRTAESSRAMMEQATLEARHLQDVLAAMMQHAIERANKMTESYDQALEEVTLRASAETESVMNALMAMTSSSHTLHMQLEESQIRADHLARRQDQAEMGMTKLLEYLDTTSLRLVSHDEDLRLVAQKAQEVLGTLNSAATSANSVQHALSTTLGFRGWWPYIYCPVVTLIMGSYGLPPSTSRNLALIGLGQLTGYGVSHSSEYLTSLTNFTSARAGSNQALVNQTRATPISSDTELNGFEV